MARRILFSVAVLMVLCWAVSYWRPGTRRPMGDLSRVQLVDGALVWTSRPLGNSRILYNGSQRFGRTLWWTGWSFTGATLTAGTVTTKVRVVPLWLPLAGAVGAALLLPRRGHIDGTCRACGYDLRGARHAVCPECGCEVKEQVGQVAT